MFVDLRIFKKIKKSLLSIQLYALIGKYLANMSKGMDAKLSV